MSDIEFELQREYYNARWHDFRFANRLKLARCIAILESVHSLGLREPRMIDLGCGSGWLTAVLGHFGPTVGVDLSDEAVKAATERFPHVLFFQADIFSWDHPGEQFDVVVSQEVIEHVDDQEGFLQIAYELLRDEGFLVLTTPNARTFYAMAEETRSSWSNQPIENWLTVPQLRRLLTPRFRVLEIRTIIPGYGVKGTYRIMNSIRLNRLLKQVRLHRWFDQVRLGFGYGLHTVALAQKARKRA